MQFIRPTSWNDFRSKKSRNSPTRCSRRQTTPMSTTLTETWASWEFMSLPDSLWRGWRESSVSSTTFTAFRGTSTWTGWVSNIHIRSLNCFKLYTFELLGFFLFYLYLLLIRKRSASIEESLTTVPTGRNRRRLLIWSWESARATRLRTQMPSTRSISPINCSTFTP